MRERAHAGTAEAARDRRVFFPKGDQLRSGLAPRRLTAMLRLVTRRALCTSVQVPTTPPAITSRVQQIFEDHSATSGLADNDTKFKVSTAC